MIISKVKEIKGTKEWTGGANGSVWYFNMIMENGDSVNLGKKDKDAIKVGDELKYEVKETDEYGIKKIKEIKEQPFQKQGFSKNYEKEAVTMCLSYAKDLVIAGKVELKDITKTADAMYKWVVLTLGLVK